MLQAADPSPPSATPLNLPRLVGPEASDSRRARILVADDDPGTLATYAMLLGEVGYSVRTAASARQCVAMIHHEAFDLVLLDMRFGHVDGIALLRRLRRLGIDVPTVIVTGFADLDAAVTAIKCGATDFVGKVMDEDELLAVVRRNLRRDGAALERAPQYATRRGPRDTNIARVLDQLNLRDTTLDFASEQRSEIATLLARAAARADLEVPDFIACAEGLRRFAAHRSDPLWHLLTEIREALTADLWRARKPSLPRITRVINELTEGRQEILARSQADWGRQLGVHSTHFGRLISAETGRPFGVWRRVCRLRRAAHLLASDENQAAQVAFAVGFEYSQTSQFSREFHQLLGVTPLAFRRLVGQRSPRS